MVRLMKKNVVWISFLLNSAALFIIPYFIEHRIAIIIAVIFGGITEALFSWRSILNDKVLIPRSVR